MAVLALAGCRDAEGGGGSGWFRPIRYRLTATVETPAGERSEFSVIEAQTNRSITRVRARGEAVAVDLPDGQVLFVLLRSPMMVDWAASLPGIPGIERDVQVHGLAERQAQLEREFDAMSRDRDVHYLWGTDVPRDQVKDLPYMVHFRKLMDPKSVEQVDPDNLAKAFGGGFHLKSLTVQVTDEAVTTGIRKRLPWLGEYPEPSLAPVNGGGVTIPTLGQFLTHGDFWKDKHQ